jgi:chromosome partitioning protein
MKVIAIGNQKGGVGKTTLSVNLAAAWKAEGKRVMLIDTDPQRSSSMWAGQSDLTVVGHDEGGLEELLPQLQGEFDVIVVDLPPGTPTATASAARIANALLIPVQPSGLDIMAAQATLDMVAEGSAKPRFVINLRKQGTKLARSARTALEAYGVDVCRQEIGGRVAYMESVLSGQSVLDYQPEGKAAQEIKSLASEVLSNAA